MGTLSLGRRVALLAVTGVMAVVAAPGDTVSAASAAVQHHGVKVPGGVASTKGTALALRSSLPTGRVTVHPTVYLVFWGSQWSGHDPKGAAPALQQFFKGLYGSKDTWGTILTQYCEGLPVKTTTCGSSGVHISHPSASPLAGVWFDNAAAEPLRAGASAIAAEAVRAARHFGNTTAASNLDAQYVIASASGLHPDGFPGSGFCGWHDATSSTVGSVAYTNLPYVPDMHLNDCTTLHPAEALDGYFSTETHEYAEVVTDPRPSTGWLASFGDEIGDLCQQQDRRITLSTGTFDVQGLWSNAVAHCTTTG
jgi:hypothetical protein